MSTSINKYGNAKYWVFDDNIKAGQEVAIWKGNEVFQNNNPIVIGRAIDLYEAKNIIDALISYENTKKVAILDKKAILFLEFITTNCQEPYSTMASNAILWNDAEAYQNLLASFPSIYEKL